MKCVKIFTLISFLFIILLNSCQKDNSDNPQDARDQFNGDFHCIENSSISGTNNYDVTISNDPSNSSQVIISNFYNLGFNSSTYAVATETSLTLLSNQPVSGATVVKGTGTLVNNKITWSYTVNIGGDKDIVTATYTRY